MEKYTIDALKAMLCKELDESVTKGIKTHDDLDIVKDLTETLKNLEEIEMNSMAKTEEMRGYSQLNSYARGNSYSPYNYYNNSYARDDRNNTDVSRAYNPYMMGNYSMTGSKDEIIKELRQMAETTNNEKMKGTILECAAKMENMM